MNGVEQVSAGHLVDVARTVLDLAARRGDRLAVAESLTGGTVLGTLTAVPGSSRSVVGGVVSYATEVKRQLLGVTAPLVISAECAEQMARGVRESLDADWAVATTGVAGPDPQEDQPVGTVYVAVAGSEGTASRRLALTGDRQEIREATVQAALALLRDALEGRFDD